MNILLLVLAFSQSSTVRLAKIVYSEVSPRAIRSAVGPNVALDGAAKILRMFRKAPTTFDANLQQVVAGLVWYLDAARGPGYEQAPHYSFIINARTGVVNSFMDYSITFRQLKNPYDDMFARQPKSAVLGRLITVAKKIGLPRGVYLKTFRVAKPDTPGVADANRAGQIEATWSNKPFGYPFLLEGAYGNSLSVSLNPADGELLSFGQRWDVKVGRHKVGITAQQAWARVPQQLKARNYRFLRLAYVIPGSDYGLPPVPKPKDWVAQLAYVFIVGKKAVYIDAGTGEYLGGLHSTDVLKIQGAL